MKFRILLIAGMLCGCQSPVYYDITGNNHTGYDASINALMNNDHHVAMWIRPNSPDGLNLTIVPGVPKKGKVRLENIVTLEKYDEKNKKKPKWLSTYYYHEFEIPAVPPLYGSNGVVLVFHTYECHVEVDTLVSYSRSKEPVPVKMLQYDYHDQKFNGHLSRRQPLYHPQCPPFDGGSYRIDIKGGYSKIVGKIEKDEPGDPLIFE